MKGNQSSFAKSDESRFSELKGKMKGNQSSFAKSDESRFGEHKDEKKGIKSSVAREDDRKRAAVVIQVYYKAYRLRLQFKEKNRAAVAIQKWFRGFRERKRLQARGIKCKQIKIPPRLRLDVKKVVKLQAILRRFLQLRENRSKRRAAICIQKNARKFQVRTIFKDIRLAVVFIQAFYRLYKYKKRLKK